MRNRSIEKNNTAPNLIDVCKLFCCILIVGSHTLPLFHSESADYYYGQWFFRFCVPFFFVCTGYFFSRMDAAKRKQYIVRIALLYAGATVLYSPFFINQSLSRIVYQLIFGYHHLWYLSALCVGLLLLLLAEKLPDRWQLPAASLLLIGGILLDEYHKILHVKYLDYLVSILSHFGGARSALFFALPLLYFGSRIGKRPPERKPAVYAAAFCLLLAASLAEAAFLKHRLQTGITLDVSVFGWMPAIPLLLFALKAGSFLSVKASRLLRKSVDAVYILHIWIAFAADQWLQIGFLPKFALVTAASFAVSLPIVLLAQLARSKKKRIVSA